MLYGVGHDQSTARVCVEYFTIAHPDIFRTESPTVLGLGWGALATLAPGLALGSLLAIAAQAGDLPRRTLRDLRSRIVWLLLAMGLIAALAGLAGYAAGRSGLISRDASYVLALPANRILDTRPPWPPTLHRTRADSVGGLLLCWRTWRERRRRSPR